MRRRTLSPPDLNPEGISKGDWVRKIKGRRKGVVESLTDNCAYVDWLDGRKEPLCCVFLRRIPPDARPDLDKMKS